MASRFQSIYTNSDPLYSVYRSNRCQELLNDDLLLVVVLPGSWSREIAVRLVDPEQILFVHYADAFADFVADLVSSHEADRFSDRLVAIRRLDAVTVECPD